MKSITTDFDKDGRRVKKLLKPLSRDELKELFAELGLFKATLENEYRDSTVAYLNDLVRAWIQERDAVLVRGRATWENLKRALQRLGHNGIADKIPVSTSGKQNESQSVRLAARLNNSAGKLHEE